MCQRVARAIRVTRGPAAHRIESIQDTAGHTLTIWVDDPDKEALSAETADEVILMKDDGGHVVGVEILHYRPPSADLRVVAETVGQKG